MCLPDSLQILHVCNINMEFSKVFTRRFPVLQKLELTNLSKRRKHFDETELKALVLMASSVSELVLESTPIDDGALNIVLQKLQSIRTTIKILEGRLSVLNAT